MCTYHIVFILCFSSCINSFEIENEAYPVVGYYWKPFTGVIPTKALKGGTNRNGSTTYIGQVYDRGLVIPTKIDLDSNSMSYEWGFQEHFVTENVNILCVDHPEQFQWLHSGNGMLHELKDKHLVKGGYESGANIYIGRIQLDDELSLGKIRRTIQDGQTTLHIVRDGVVQVHLVFQILVYNPNVAVEGVKYTPDSI